MQLDLSSLTLALGAGVVAFLNPCGFVLLPSYVAHYLGSRESGPRSWWTQSQRGLVVGLAVSAGFFTVFILTGAIITLLGTAVGEYLPWAAVAVGIGLILLGIRMLLRERTDLFAITWADRLTHERGESSLGFYYLYGISYALASSGCTLPIFMIYVISPALASGALSGFVNFIAYASGMTVMMLLLSLSLSFSKGGLDRNVPIRWALLGLGLSFAALVAMMWFQPDGLSARWLLSIYGENQLLFVALAPALVLLLLFQLWRWDRSVRWLNGLILLLAGSYLIYYQFKIGLLS
ncbi:cytochrome c biogenesis CcdA family protein [Candidatus Acetothermia bacterium]|jgi:cytochrome c biogenesis protein CcdA|nr:cytochrome c biogenesis CcdA family protein [Candidatus Acetothermia bacterium]MCI2431692.1 cytochrome c biogenesis CcdA family protein [Candidatus Acetothermia bacterium]MCI2435667.1 cytochrome c biogenesis CcdA family protein [Candidatus Acetothermia bacterium]